MYCTEVSLFKGPCKGGSNIPISKFQKVDFHELHRQWKITHGVEANVLRGEPLMIVGGARAKVKKKIVSSPFQEKKNCKCQGAEKIKKQVTSGPEKK